jgi:hypothetical protein
MRRDGKRAFADFVLPGLVMRDGARSQTGGNSSSKKTHDSFSDERDG